MQNTSGRRSASNTSVRLYWILEISGNKVYVGKDLAVKVRAVEVVSKISKNLSNKSKYIG